MTGPDLLPALRTVLAHLNAQRRLRLVAWLAEATQAGGDDALRPFGATLAEPRRLVLRYRRESDAVGRILGAVHAAGLRVADFTTDQPNLEDVSLDLVGHTNRGS